MAAPGKKTITVKKISDDTYILPDDIITTLKEMGILEQRKKGNAKTVINKANARAWAQGHRVSLLSPVDMEAFTIREDSVGDEEEEDEEG